MNLKLNNERDRLLSEDRERIDIEDQLIKLDTELQTLYTEKKNFQSTLSQAEQDFFSAKITSVRSKTASETSADTRQSCSRRYKI